MAAARPLTVRLSAALRDLVAAAGAEHSAGARALLLLGAHAAGYDLAPLEAELHQALGQSLDPPLRAALRRLLAVEQLAAARPPASAAPPAAVAAAADPGDDPLGEVGIEV